MTDQQRRPRTLAGLVIGFGALTILSGGRTLLGTVDMGAVVPFVLWFNTFAGIAYVISGIGLWQGRPWAPSLAFAIFLATLLVFAAFGLHVLRGGAFEMRTVFAMALRTAVWGGIALAARRTAAGGSG